MTDILQIPIGEGTGRIPVRNLWLLYFYASDLYSRLEATERQHAEAAPDQLPELTAAILAQEVSYRLKRDLTTHFVPREAVLTSVRGAIDHLGTERGQLLAKGRVRCRFDELTVDTPRNRYLLAALNVAFRRLRISRRAATDLASDIAQECLSLAMSLQRQGVAAGPPDLTLPRRETFGHYDNRDRRAVAAAQFVLEWALPSRMTGGSAIQRTSDDQNGLPKLFERAVRNFYKVNLQECRVSSRNLNWPGTEQQSLFPIMKTDITIDRPDHTQLIIDTKFTSALGKAHRPADRRTLRSGHLYQLYAYLRTQHRDAQPAAGLLLYPSTSQAPIIDESAVMHGHTIRAATVDLAAPASEIKARLLELAETC